MTMTVEQAVNVEAADARPGWLQFIGSRYSNLQAHAFLLHGNIFDYEIPGTTLRPFIAGVFSVKFPVCVTYSSGTGFTFPSTELNRSKEVFVQFLAEHGYPGLSDQDLARVAPDDGVLLLLDFLRMSPTHSTLGILDRVDLFAGHDCKSAVILEALHNAGTDPSLENSQNLLFLLTPDLASVHSDVLRASSGTMPVEMNLPNEAERLLFIHQRVRMKNGVVTDKVQLKLAMSEEDLAKATSGLTRRNIEDILLAGITENALVTWEIVNQLTAEIITKEAAGLLNVVKPKYGSNYLGGMAQWKAYGDRWIVRPARGNHEQRRAMPKVLLFVGPPGTGKTEAAYALGKDLEWNVLELLQIKGSLVGETGKNLAKIKAILAARKPWLLFIDEIDQYTRRVTGGSGGGGDSVEAEIFRFILMLCNDENLRGEGLIVMASNNPPEIDGALLDRCDAIVPFLPAENGSARSEILSKQMTRKGVSVTPEALLPVGEALDNSWSGRDMQALVAKAYGLMQMDSLDAEKALTAAAKTRKPQQRPDAEIMIEWAKTYCNDTDLLSPEWRIGIKDRKALDKEIAEARGRTFSSNRDF